MEATGSPIGPPRDFQDLVRDALLHLHDPSYLQVHPLQSLLTAAPADTTSRGRLLYRALLGAIEITRPEIGTPPDSRAWRSYRILELRYVDGREAGEISEEMALSKNQYHRDHGRALQAIASLIWDDWRLGERHVAPNAPDQRSDREARDLARIEVRSLHADERGCGVAPSEVIDGVRALVAPLFLQRAITFDVVPHAPLPTIQGERIALRHTLITLLTSALKEPGVREVRLNAEPFPERLEISITLRGALPTAPTGPATTGPIATGVAASLPFVESFNGRLSTSCLDGDLVVGFALPRAASWRPTLLVVDNSSDFARLVERYLAAEPWTVQSAEDVESALVLAATGRISTVLLDIVLPGRDGWELLQLLKSAEVTRRIPVIVCSVFNEPEVALSLGAVSYLQKPVAKQQLIDALAVCRLG